MNKVGKYLSKHKKVLSEESHFSLQKVFDLLRNQSDYSSIDSVIEKLDTTSELLTSKLSTDQNIHNAQPVINESEATDNELTSQATDSIVHSSADAHIEHSSDIDRGIPGVEDNKVNFSSDQSTTVASDYPEENISTDSTPVPGVSQSFHSEMFFLPSRIRAHAENKNKSLPSFNDKEFRSQSTNMSHGFRT